MTREAGGPVTAPAAPRRSFSPLRFGAIFGSAVVLGHVGQFAWLIAGSRAMTVKTFAAVLAAQALYGAAQLVVDTGSGFYGARLAAADVLTRDSRGSLVRLRLQMSWALALVTLAVGAIGGVRSLEACAPFALALGLFAILNYWEPFGRGQARPWSAYVVLRSVAPALAVCLFLAADVRFPAFLPGVLECVVICVVAIAFRLGPFTALVDALRATRGPWRSVVKVGLPALLLQLALAAGPVLTNAVGHAAAAASLAVSARVLTGLNQLSGLVATSLFPRLAQRGGDGEGEPHGRSVGIGLRAILVVTLGASAIVFAKSTFFVSLFLAHPGGHAQAVLILTVSTAAAVGFLTFMTLLLVAYHRERLAVEPFVAGAVVTVVGGFAVVAAAPASTSGVWMAGALAVGLSLALAYLVWRSHGVVEAVRGTLFATAATALVVTALGFVAAVAPAARTPAAAVIALAAASLAAVTLVPLVRGARAES